MNLKIDDWQFDIDIDATMAYSATEAADHCTCAYCRNFYAAVDTAYPDLRPFLAQFGLDIEAPDELMPYDVNQEMVYDGAYAVIGRILHTGKTPIRIGDVDILPTVGDSGLHSEPCFRLDVSTIVLPWVLDEPMEETVSPANEPSFLKKMWDRLLGKAPKSDINS